MRLPKMKKPNICTSLPLTSKLETYMENSSIHGFRYLVDGKTHLAERSKLENNEDSNKVDVLWGRFFWLLMCCLSFAGTAFLFVATLNNYQNNPISFVTETTYLNWNIIFPAVAVCVEFPLEIAYKIRDEHPLLQNESTKVSHFFAKDVFGCRSSGRYCRNCFPTCRRASQRCTGDITPLLPSIREYRSYFSCEEVISKCKWNGEEFDCCSKFDAIDTYMGRCYVINSMQTPRYNNKSSKMYKKLDLVSNRKLGPGTLTFDHHGAQAQIHLMAPEDVIIGSHPPDLTNSNLYNYGRTVKFEIQTTEVVNDPLLREVPIEQRGCRFPDENPYAAYPYYSYSTCMIECIKKEQIKKCGCVYHCMPEIDSNETKICTDPVTNMNCIEKFSKHWDEPAKVTDPEVGVNCLHCLPSCTAPDYNVVRKVENFSRDRQIISNATIQLSNLPSHRYIRNVVRSKLDLVVALGGAAGLFLGASVLSLVELLYYCFVRGKDIKSLQDKERKPEATLAMIFEKKTWKDAQQIRRRNFFDEPDLCYYPRDYAYAPQALNDHI